LDAHAAADRAIEERLHVRAIGAPLGRAFLAAGVLPPDVRLHLTRVAVVRDPRADDMRDAPATLAGVSPATLGAVTLPHDHLPSAGVAVALPHAETRVAARHFVDHGATRVAVHIAAIPADDDLGIRLRREGDNAEQDKSDREYMLHAFPTP